jgi:sec-independent protein translocase protein TatB
MFFDFGAGEIFGLGVLAVILVGPERLPQLAVDAAKLIKKVRTMATSATTELRENLGPRCASNCLRSRTPSPSARTWNG